jgi:Domain of unknown function (DUF5615)
VRSCCPGARCRAAEDLMPSADPIFRDRLQSSSISRHWYARPTSRRTNRGLPSLREPSGRSSHRCGVTLWLDAQLSPALAPWLAATCNVSCTAVRDLGLREAVDRDIFMAGRAASAVIVTKDADFVRLLEQLTAGGLGSRAAIRRTHAYASLSLRRGPKYADCWKRARRSSFRTKFTSFRWRSRSSDPRLT